MSRNPRSGKVSRSGRCKLAKIVAGKWKPRKRRADHADVCP